MISMNNKKFHFVGIGGIGMSGIAEILHKKGYKVSGSDICQNSITKHLIDIGITVYKNHSLNNVLLADILVISSAISTENVEVKYALSNNIKIISRAIMLAELMLNHYTTAVAGAHGKTSTTALIYDALKLFGFNPNCIIGGILNEEKSNIVFNENSKCLVLEADESDGSFVNLYPNIAVITNIDNDHLNHYHSIENIKKSFLEFASNVQDDGVVIACIENSYVLDIIKDIKRPIIKYGFSNSDIYATDIKSDEFGSSFLLNIPEHNIKQEFSVNLYGKHNVLNTLAAIAVLVYYKVDIRGFNKIRTQGVDRRCKNYGSFKIKNKNILLIDDYGHHPTEITATYNAIANSHKKNTILLFQPHRYTRTKELFNEFVDCLSEIASVANVIILDVYSGGEESNGVTGKELSDAIQKSHYVKTFVDAVNISVELLKDDNLVITMGAGDVDLVCNMLMNYKK